MPALPPAATCCICGDTEAYPSHGHKMPFCKKHHKDWEESGEYKRMVSARMDFVRRVKGELANATPR